MVVEYFQQELSEIMKGFDIEEAVISSGSKGGRVETITGEKFEYRAAMPDRVSNPTGAGDVFFAAYLLSREVNNLDISSACRYAAGIAARQVEGRYIAPDRLALS